VRRRAAASSHVRVDASTVAGFRVTGKPSATTRSAHDTRRALTGHAQRHRPV